MSGIKYGDITSWARGTTKPIVRNRIQETVKLAPAIDYPFCYRPIKVEHNPKDVLIIPVTKFDETESAVKEMKKTLQFHIKAEQFFHSRIKKTGSPNKGFERSDEEKNREILGKSKNLDSWLAIQRGNKPLVLLG